MEKAAVIETLQSPSHVAIIMDGNGRWAKSRGLPRTAGHEKVASTVQRCVLGSLSSGVRWLTLFAFSTENWRRPEAEVEFLMRPEGWLVTPPQVEFYRSLGVAVKFVGRFSDNRIPRHCRAWCEAVEEQTATCDARLTLTFAFNYGGRAEIIDGLRTAIRLGDPEVSEDQFGAMLCTANLPEVDLLIRTSGEQRISNFLLWRSAYAELLFVQKLWPDFSEEDLADAIAHYRLRSRRFGSCSPDEV